MTANREDNEVKELLTLRGEDESDRDITGKINYSYFHVRSSLAFRKHCLP